MKTSKFLFFVIILSHYAFSNPCLDINRTSKELDLPEEVFSKNQLLILKSFADDLVKKTTQNDVIVFVGRSLWIAKHYFDEKIGESRNYHLVSFSGQPYKELDKAGIYTLDQETLTKYKQYLDTTKLIPALQKLVLSNGRLVLVDFTITGEGIKQFARLLRQLNLITDTKTVALAIMNLFEPEIMSNPYFSVRRDFANEQKYRFKLELWPYSLHNRSEFEAKTGHFLVSIFGRWEYSLPGLGHFPKEKWGTYNPNNCPETANIPQVKSYSTSVWSNN